MKNLLIKVWSNVQYCIFQVNFFMSYTIAHVNHDVHIITRKIDKLCVLPITTWFGNALFSELHMTIDLKWYGQAHTWMHKNTHITNSGLDTIKVYLLNNICLSYYLEVEWQTNT